MMLPNLVRLLKRRPYTADALARQLKCSRPTAQRRLRAAGTVLKLVGARQQLKSKMVRKGLRGPLSRAYFVE